MTDLELAQLRRAPYRAFFHQRDLGRLAEAPGLTISAALETIRCLEADGSTPLAGYATGATARIRIVLFDLEFALELLDQYSAAGDLLAVASRHPLRLEPVSSGKTIIFPAAVMLPELNCRTDDTATYRAEIAFRADPVNGRLFQLE